MKFINIHKLIFSYTIVVKTGATIAIIIIIIIVGGIGLLAYSYTQINVSLDDVKLHSIDWMSLTWSNVLRLGLDALTGNWLSAAFDLIQGVNLNLYFGLTNNGFLPVYIPDLSYDLFINDIPVGKGYTSVDATINPRETKTLPVLQNFQKTSLSPAIGSIVSNNGWLDLMVKGTAHFKLFGIDIPIPFESSKQISITDEVKKRLNAIIEENQLKSTNITLSISDYTVTEGDSIVISGRLTSDGRGLSNASIYIKDEDTGSGDDTITTIRTDSSGNFRKIWSAKQMDPFDSTVEIYAVFEGSQSYDSSRSRQYSVSVQEQTYTQSSSQSESQYTPPQNTFRQTSLSRKVPYTTVNAGDVLSISGKLIDSSGRALENASIYIKDEDTGSGDDDIAIVRTNSNGQFNYNWNTKKMDPFDRIVELYAVFEGTSNFGYSRSIQIDVRVN